MIAVLMVVQTVAALCAMVAAIGAWRYARRARAAAQRWAERERMRESLERMRAGGGFL